MGIYRIMITHNRPWSVREIIAFSILFLIATVILIVLYRKNRIRGMQVFAGQMMLLYLGIVFASTVFTRVSGQRAYELVLFWSWREVFLARDYWLLEENLLNMLLLLPAGFLLPMLLRKKLPWWAGLLFGVGVSAVIETSQLLFCRGLFEWDDMVHNGLGCMVGAMLYGLLLRISSGEEAKKTGERIDSNCSEQAESLADEAVRT